jgi:hypothetical protein
MVQAELLYREPEPEGESAEGATNPHELITSTRLSADASIRGEKP